MIGGQADAAPQKALLPRCRAHRAAGCSDLLATFASPPRRQSPAALSSSLRPPGPPACRLVCSEAGEEPSTPPPLPLNSSLVPHALLAGCHHCRSSALAPRPAVVRLSPAPTPKSSPRAPSPVLEHGAPCVPLGPPSCCSEWGRQLWAHPATVTATACDDAQQLQAGPMGGG